MKRNTPETLTKALDEAKKILESSAQTNRNLFIAFNFALITTLVLCLSVTDEDLLLGSSTVELPLLTIKLPIWAFASIAPMMLVALHFDLLHNLTEHRDKLTVWSQCWFKVHSSPSRNTDMPRQLYPFLFDFAWLHANHTGSTVMRSRLLPGLCWLLYCWAAYTVLAIFFIRFADLQHYGYTGWHLLLLIFDGLVLHWYWPGFSQDAKPVAWKPLLAMIFAPLWLVPYLGRKALAGFNLSRAQLLLLWLSNTVVLWTLVLFTLVQAHIDFGTSPAFIQQALAWERTSHSLVGLNLVPRLSLSGFRLTLPDKFFELAKLQQPDKNESQLWQETRNALDLSERRLAFADFDSALLPHVNLSFAQLQGASLDNIRLQGASLAFAQMQGTSLNLAQLQGASLDFAQLQGAYLGYAQLQGAYLFKAQLQVAYFDNTQLQGATLAYAHLKDVVLTDSQQLTSSWTEQLDWQQDYDFTGLKAQSWAQTKAIQQQLEQAQQRLKDFELPQLKPPLTKEAFAPIWLGLLCKDADATKGMLYQLRLGNHPITKPQARQYLNSHEECKPYRNMLPD